MGRVPSRGGRHDRGCEHIARRNRYPRSSACRCRRGLEMHVLWCGERFDGNIVPYVFRGPLVRRQAHRTGTPLANERQPGIAANGRSDDKNKPQAQACNERGLGREWRQR